MSIATGSVAEPESVWFLKSPRRPPFSAGFLSTDLRWLPCPLNLRKVPILAFLALALPRNHRALFGISGWEVLPWIPTCFHSHASPWTPLIPPTISRMDPAAISGQMAPRQYHPRDLGQHTWGYLTCYVIMAFPFRSLEQLLYEAFQGFLLLFSLKVPQQVAAKLKNDFWSGSKTNSSVWCRRLQS